MSRPFAGLGALTLLSWLRVARLGRRVGGSKEAQERSDTRLAMAITLPLVAMALILIRLADIEEWVQDPMMHRMEAVLALMSFVLFSPFFLHGAPQLSHSRVVHALAGPVAPRAFVVQQLVLLGQLAIFAGLAWMLLFSFPFLVFGNAPHGLLRPWLVGSVLFASLLSLRLAAEPRLGRLATKLVPSLVVLSLGLLNAWILMDAFELGDELLRRLELLAHELITLQSFGAWALLAAIATLGALGVAWSFLRADTLRDVLVEQMEADLLASTRSARGAEGPPAAAREA